MLKLLDHKRLPNGSRNVVKNLRGTYEETLRFRSVVQVNKWQRHGTDLALLAGLLPAASDFGECFLLFRRVSSHTDDWPKVKHGNRWVAPAFVHLVLHGCAVVSVGRHSRRFTAGDLFVMDMNRRHSVDSESLCITAVSTVPRLLHA